VAQHAESISDPVFSREQSRFVHEDGKVHVENLGRLPLFVNGDRVDRAPLSEGDVLEFGDRLMVLVARRATQLEGAVSPGHAFGRPDAIGWVGESPAAWSMRASVAFLAGRSAHVLVLGESGTGKELIAAGLHEHSDRRRHPMVSRNAATIPESLADAELFGNLGGYPNPGLAARPGLIGEAHRSTLFLDEFGELSVPLQARLLRVLDAGEYTRLGEARPRKADLRLIAATNRDPAELKHDVLARLPIRIQVPSLTERREDIPLIAAHLMRRIAREDPKLAKRFFPGGDPDAVPRMSLQLLRQLLSRPYTTHVRELEALLWRAITASEGDVLGPLASEKRSPAVTSHVTEGPTDPASLDPELIQQTLDRHGGRQEPTWRELRLASRHVLARLVKKYGLKVRGR